MECAFQRPGQNAAKRRIPTHFRRLNTYAQNLIQYLMGHSDISVTLNTYTHLGPEDAEAELHRMEEIENARKEQNKMDGSVRLQAV